MGSHPLSPGKLSPSLFQPRQVNRRFSFRPPRIAFPLSRDRSFLLPAFRLVTTRNLSLFHTRVYLRCTYIHVEGAYVFPPRFYATIHAAILSFVSIELFGERLAVFDSGS